MRGLPPTNRALYSTNHIKVSAADEEREHTNGYAISSEWQERIDFLLLEVAHQQRGAQIGQDAGDQSTEQRWPEHGPRLGLQQLRDFEDARGQDDRRSEQERESRRRLVLETNQ